MAATLHNLLDLRNLIAVDRCSDDITPVGCVCMKWGISYFVKIVAQRQSPQRFAINGPVIRQLDVYLSK